MKPKICASFLIKTFYSYYLRYHISLRKLSLTCRRLIKKHSRIWPLFLLIVHKHIFDCILRRWVNTSFNIEDFQSSNHKPSSQWTFIKQNLRKWNSLTQSAHYFVFKEWFYLNFHDSLISSWLSFIQIFVRYWLTSELQALIRTDKESGKHHKHILSIS